MTTDTRPASLNSNITGVIRVLMALRGGMTQTDLAAQLGVDKAVISRSFRDDRPWKVEELDALARLFDVPPGTFFEGPEALLRSRCFPSGDVTESVRLAA